MAQRPGVGVGIVVKRGGRVLLGRRSGAHGASTWSFPGGHIEFGESLEDCAARELVEETGLLGSNFKVVAVTNDLFSSEGLHYVTVFVECDCPEGSPRELEPGKYSGMAWFEWANLPTPLFLPAANLVKQGYSPFK